MRLTEDEHRALVQKSARAAVDRKAGLASPKLSAVQKMQTLGRLKNGEMNNTEKAYAAHLADRLYRGSIAWYEFEGIKFRLADKTFYSPDFAVMLADDSMEIHEVKGFWTDDARVKIKVAAAMFPFKFIAVKKQSKKDGGGWQYEEF